MEMSDKMQRTDRDVTAFGRVGEHDDAILAEVLRRFINDRDGFYGGFAGMTAPGLFCVDASIDVTDAEEAAIERATEPIA